MVWVKNHRPSDFENWLPVKLYRDGDALALSWQYMHDLRFEKPFFDDTIGRLKTLNSIPPVRFPLRTTPLEALPKIADALDSTRLSLLIFHTSRCGSTLLSQVLSMNPAFVVVSEYGIIDQILRLQDVDSSITDEYRDLLLKSSSESLDRSGFPRRRL